MTPLEALQAALEIEHQVVYGYGVVGARVAARSQGVTREECIRRLDEHRALRDALEALVRQLGATPETGSLAYDLPFPVRRWTEAARLGVVLEDATAGAMWDLAEAASGGSPPRRLAVTQLAAAAEWAALWRESGFTGGWPPALPGQPATSQPSTSPTISSSVSTTPSGSTS